MWIRDKEEGEKKKRKVRRKEAAAFISKLGGRRELCRLFFLLAPGWRGWRLRR